MIRVKCYIFPYFFLIFTPYASYLFIPVIQYMCMVGSDSSRNTKAGKFFYKATEMLQSGESRELRTLSESHNI